MQKLKLALFIIILFTFKNLNSQTFISVRGTFNYWQHTELFGPGIGLGFEYERNNLLLSVNYDFGYGTINRLKSFENLNYDNWSTVMVETESGKWSEYLCCRSLEDIYELSGTSDYGKQHQLTLQMGYIVLKNNKYDFLIKAGGFAAIVEQFYTFKNIPFDYIDLSPFYRGPLNYIPSTSQKIMTFGVNMELALNYKSINKNWTPFINFGVGPKHSSYLGVGIRLSTLLRKKE